MANGYDQDPRKQEFWKEHWASGTTPWDQGRPHPRLERLLAVAREHGFPGSGRILEPGCGRAHGAAWLVEQGYEATAFDAAPEAVAEAKGLYGDRKGLEICQGDAFCEKPEWRGRFAGVYDRAVYCAFPADVRRAYAETCWRCLEPGGYLLSLPFTELTLGADEGPPFALTIAEMSHALEDLFSLVAAEEHERTPDDPASVIVREAVTVWRRQS